MFWNRQLREHVELLTARLNEAQLKLAAMEKYHNLRYCEGEHNAPHYRRAWNPPKKRGRKRGAKITL